MTQQAVPGRGLATRRALAGIVRRAALGSYGVVSVSGPRPWDDLRAWLDRSPRGVRVRRGPPLRIDLFLGVARGVPVAEVAHNVDDAVRHSLRRAVGREIDELAIHVDRLASVPAGTPRERGAPTPEGGGSGPGSEAAADS